MKHLDLQFKACLVLAAVSMALIPGCGKGMRSAPSVVESQLDLDIGEDGTPMDYSKPVYSKEIKHLMNKHCAGCHQAGGVAPFPLNSYDDVARHAASIRSSVLGRTMPPPGVDNSGACQDFSNAKWLKEEEIDAITRWTDTGMPKGDPKSLSSAPPEIPNLTGDIQALKMPQPYTPAPPAGTLDDYRCFVLDPGHTEDTVITATQVLPDKVQEVHHVIVFKPNTLEAQLEAEQKSGADGRPGYTCFGAAGVPSQIVGLWAPGGAAKEMRDADTGQLIGIPLEKGRKLILQIHYNSQNGIWPDQSSIVIKKNPTALKAKWMVLAHSLLDIAPQVTDHIESDEQGSSWFQVVNIIFERGLADDYINGGGILSALSWELVGLILNQPDPRDFRVYAVAPHMHTLGRRLTIDKVSTDPAQSKCLAEVPKFDFHWQGGYHYKKPLTITKTDRLKITCHYNTMSRTEAVSFGEGTEDEMCLAFFMVGE